jgi:hypothetical protein
MIPSVELEQAEAGRLRDRLAEIEAEQAALEAELAIFHAEYARRVLTVLAQVQELDARILARDGHPGEAREARTRARRTTSEARAVPAAPGPPPTADLKRLFRDAAKRMHPDLAPDPEARAHAEAFMKRLNDAYRAGDGEAIADLVRQWAASPYGDGVIATSAPRLAGLAAAVRRAEQRLDEVRASELADLMEQTMAAAAAGRDHLGELRAGAEAALAAARARLAET